MSRYEIVRGKTRRYALWLMAGLTSTVALHACTQQPSSDEKSTSTTPVAAKLAANLWVGYIPLYIASEKGFFSNEGLNLESIIFSGSSEGNSAFVAGRIEGTVAVTSEAVTLANQTQNYRIVMVADTSKGGDGILARNSIADIAAFKGKQVGVEPGSVSHFFLLQVLKEAGLSKDDIEIVNLTADSAAAAYQAGKVDIVVTYAPFLQQANEAQKDGRIIYDTSKMPAAIVDVYLFNSKFIDENPQAIQVFVNGIIKGMEFLETNREEALAIASKKLQQTVQDTEDQLKGVELIGKEKNIEMLSDPNSNLYLGKQMESLGEFLVAQKQLNKIPVELTKLLEPKFVKSV
ncbi:MAG: ABC transporter substrate-binding protein [Hydrococcus sp. Prado102]|jgi:NitT/TauT family transport system substrate-binding protein|nr:ABC transporter substrate-binding protein [Hydrococcus sp. Prado102]